MLIHNWLGIRAHIVPVDRQLDQFQQQLLEHPGNYIMVAQGSAPPFLPTALYTGIARHLGDRLLGLSHEKWPRAHACGVTHVHLFEVPDEGVSRDFETVLRYELEPPLQDQPRPAHLTASKAARRVGFEEIADRAYARHELMMRLLRQRPADRPNWRVNALSGGLFNLLG